MDLNQILPHLFLGTCPTCSEDIDQLRDSFGITAVVDLQSRDDFHSREIDEERLDAHYDQLGIEVRHVPVEDSDSDGLQRRLAECVQALEAFLGDGRTVYVHCRRGVNRAPSVVVAYLHWVQDWAFGAAMRHVMQCRPCSPQVTPIRLATEVRMRDQAEKQRNERRPT